MHVTLYPRGSESFSVFNLFSVKVTLVAFIIKRELLVMKRNSTLRNVGPKSGILRLASKLLCCVQKPH